MTERVDEGTEVAGGAHAVRVVNVADWSDETHSGLAVHEPEPTDTIVELELKH